MINIISTLEKIGFLSEEDGTYIGYGINNKEAQIKFEFKNHFLICTEAENVVFSIIYFELKVSTFLVLLQEYSIINYTPILNGMNSIEASFNKWLNNQE